METTGLNRRGVLKAGVAAAAAATIGMPWVARSAATPIKIGFPTSLTGPYAAETGDQVRCAKIAIQEFNDAGGFEGRLAELVVRDDKLNPGEGAARALELIENEKVDFIVGTLSGAVQLSINNVTRERGVIFVPISASDEIVEAKGWSKYTFHEALTPRMVTTAVGRYSFTNFGKRAAVLAADYAYGREMSRGFKAAAQRFGATIVAEVYHPLGAADFSAFFPQIQAAKPDILFLANYGADQLNGVKQATDFGLKKGTRIVIPVLSLSARKAGGSEVFEDVVGGASYYWRLEDTFKTSRHLNEAYRKAYDGGVPDYGAHGYTAVKCLLECVVATKTTNADAVAKMMATLKYDYCKGPQHYRECDHQSVQSFVLLQSRQTSSEKDNDVYKILSVEQLADSDLPTCQEEGH